MSTKQSIQVPTQRNEPVIPTWTRGDRLRKARTLTGMTVREFAEVIGVSHGTISNAETDSREVRKIVLNAYSLATGVPVQWLETGAYPSGANPDGDGPIPAGDAPTPSIVLKHVSLVAA